MKSNDELFELHELREQLKVMQLQLQQSQKMAAQGNLAAGIAHELNNPIGYIKNNVAALHEYMQVLLPVVTSCMNYAAEKQNAELQQRIDTIVVSKDLQFMIEDIEPLLNDAISGSDKLERIVDGLKRFTRNDNSEREWININQCVEDTLKVLWNKLKYKASVKKQLGELLPVQGKPGEINQVIMNLLLNAADAIPKFGEINIVTKASGSDVILSISDNGKGIPEADIGKIFTAFFTTKSADKGAGLGLSVSNEIILKHGGRMDVSSEQNIGTTFIVTLPCVED
jgi:two-component system, NtrC family, sensor kinase